MRIPVNFRYHKGLGDACTADLKRPGRTDDKKPVNVDWEQAVATQIETVSPMHWKNRVSRLILFHRSLFKRTSTPHHFICHLAHVPQFRFKQPVGTAHELVTHIPDRIHITRYLEFPIGHYLGVADQVIPITLIGFRITQGWYWFSQSTPG